MVNENQDLKSNNSNVLGILAGLLIGCVAGAVTMLLLAPQSGKDTRRQIQQKSIELRDRTTGMMDDAMHQVRLKADQITVGGRQKAEDLKQQGQELLAEQLGRVSTAAQAGKKAIERA
jgi:gas vesicle protein